MRLLIAFLIFLALLPYTYAYVGLEVSAGSGSLTAGNPISGTVTITHDFYLEPNYKLRFFIDDNFTAETSLANFVQNLTYYSYKDHTFSYKIVGEGINRWEEFVTQNFNYVIRAQGTRGDPPVAWQITSGELPGSISKADGFRQIKDGSQVIGVPPDNNGDTVWLIYDQNNKENVILEMRETCGNSNYASFPTDSDGWVRTKLACSNSECDDPANAVCKGSLCSRNLDGTTNTVTFLPEFDDASLDSKRNSHIAEGLRAGGIYKNGAYQQRASQADWNGTAGEVKIFNFDPDSSYDIVFLPPNGPLVCAYTNSSIAKSQSWTANSSIISGFVNIGSPYKMTYKFSNLPQKPACPPPGVSGACLQSSVSNYYAQETTDPDNVISITSFFDSAKTGNLNISATSSSKNFSRNYTTTVNLGLVPGLKTPGPGDHVLKAVLLNQAGTEIQSGSATIKICEDSDKDGYCRESDCDDGNPSISPGKSESCNNIDDNCNGKIDDGFNVDATCGELFGICAGVFVCSPDGKSVICESRIQPGQQEEICANGLDDDCDGITDESPGTVVDNVAQTCKFTCEEGKTRPYGSDVGECVAGTQTCRSNEWVVTKKKSGPFTEVCDRKDNDCDGTIDDARNGDSVQSTRCQCYNSGSPSTETCNDIDDDCDGTIDEGLTCCSDGDTRQCEEQGVCSSGAQECGNGAWGSCSIQPKLEICFNNLDDNCDGQADEDCDPTTSCSNGIQDANEQGVDCGGNCLGICPENVPSFILIVSGVIILIILAALVLYFRSQGKELTWEELTKRWSPAKE